MNSVSLFSFSNHSLLSSSSSPICSDEQQFSSSVSNRNEPDASSVINSLESENKFVQNDLQAISLHSSPTIQTILLNFCTDRVRRLEFHRCCPALEDLQSPSQILKHLCDFPLPSVDLGLQSFQCSKIRSAQHWGRRGAHLSENKGVKSECKKFGENSRQMAAVQFQRFVTSIVVHTMSRKPVHWELQFFCLKCQPAVNLIQLFREHKLKTKMLVT